MSPLETLLENPTDRSLRTATLVGLSSVPFTAVLSWRSLPDDVVTVAGGTVSGTPLFVAGVIVGYLYYERPTGSRRAGVRAGLVGSIGTVLLYLYNALVTVQTASTGVSAAAVVLTPIAVVLGVGLSVLVTTIGAVTGDWLAGRVSRVRPIVARD